MAMGYELDSQGSIPDKEKRLLSSHVAFRPPLGLIQPPVQWIPRAQSPEYSNGDMKLIFHHLVPRLSTVQLYLHFPCLIN
jgi:hypothetical protein